jgi:hypothetical protein
VKEKGRYVETHRESMTTKEECKGEERLREKPKRDRESAADLDVNKGKEQEVVQ